MKLFYGVNSGNSARALFGLLESGLPFERVLLDTRAQENLAPGYLALNPMGKIPSLLDGDFQLWESNAINLYVAEKNPGAGLLPDSAQGRALVQRWLFFQSAHVSPACIPIFRARNERVRAFWNAKVEPQVLEASLKELSRYLPVLEQALRGRAFFEGQFSLADVALAPHLVLVQEGRFDFSPYPNLLAWLSRITARPAWQETARTLFTAP